MFNNFTFNNLKMHSSHILRPHAQPAFTYLKLTINTRTRRKICSKLTIKTPGKRRSGVFIVNFEHISHVVLMFLFLTLNT